MRPPPRPAGAAHLAVTFALLLAVAWLADGWRGAAPARQGLRARAVDASGGGLGDTVRILRRLRLIHPVPRWLAAGAAGGEAPPAMARGFGRGRGAARPIVYRLDRLDDEDLVLALRIEPWWLLKPAAVVSLLIEPEDLAALNGNPGGRGREWERPAFFAYLEDGELRYSSMVGVRLHGGWTRDYPEAGSYRVYFRGRYGARRFAPEVFAHRAHLPPRELVIRNDGGRTQFDDQRHFTSPIAYDIARRIGSPAPHTRPVAFFLNGRFMGVKALTEWVHLDYLQAHFGGDRWVLVRTKRGKHSPGSMVKEGDPRRYRALVEWLRAGGPRSAEEAAARVDLDNLSRWALAVLFCATKDVFQGPLVLDEGAPVARWFWVAWDLDQSFGYPEAPGDWRHDSFRPLLKGNDPRAILLRRLIADSAAFRQRFAELFTEVMNHRLTADFLGETIARYRTTARLYGLEAEFAASGDAIADFVFHRAAALRQQMAVYLGVGESFEVRVEAPAGRRLTVDGYPTAAPYAGWYFAGQTVEVATPDPGLSHWTVGGERRAGGGAPLRLTVRSDLAVEAVSSPPAPGRPAAPAAAVAPEAVVPVPAVDAGSRRTRPRASP